MMNKILLWTALLGFSLIQEIRAQEPITDEVYAVNNTKNKKSVIPTVEQQEQPDPDGNQTGTIKKFSRSFSADRQDKINISNQFGSILVKTWSRNEVRLDATIKAESSEDRQGRRLIDQVNISADKTGDQISFRTQISQEKSRWNRKKSGEIRVDCILYVPVSSALTLNQQYGNIKMDDFSGPLSIKLQYGDLVAGRLNSDNNYISVQYGKSNIAELKKGTIKQQYGSGLSIGTAGTLDLDIQYAGANITRVTGNAEIKQQYGSGLVLGSVGNLVINSQYANAKIGEVRGHANVIQQYNTLTMENVGNLDLKAEYSSVNLSRLRGNGTFHMSYNNLTIGQVMASSRNLQINSNYVGVKLDFADNYHGDFDVKQSYGSFSRGSRVELNSTGNEDNKKGSTRIYTGKIGNGANSNIRINSTYGGLNLN